MQRATFEEPGVLMWNANDEADGKEFVYQVAHAGIPVFVAYKTYNDAGVNVSISRNAKPFQFQVPGLPSKTRKAEGPWGWKDGSLVFSGE